MGFEDWRQAGAFKVLLGSKITPKHADHNVFIKRL